MHTHTPVDKDIPQVCTHRHTPKVTPEVCAHTPADMATPQMCTHTPVDTDTSQELQGDTSALLLHCQGRQGKWLVTTGAPFLFKSDK